MLMCILVYMFMFMFMLMFMVHENQEEHGLGHDMNMILNVDIGGGGDDCWQKNQSPAIGKSRIQEAKSKIYIFSDNFFENINFNIKIS
jgi:hypothetical protein